MGFAPTGREAIAQGNALGSRPKSNPALKGRNPSDTISANLPCMPPFQGLVMVWGAYPGRCPGLSQGAPSGLGNDGSSGCWAT